MLANAIITSFTAVSNVPAAKQFYEQTLGLKLVADEAFALVFSANGTPVRLQKVPEFQPQPFTVLGWQVADIESAIHDLRHKGVQFEQFPGISQNELGIAVFEDGTQVAWFKDPDGNLLSFHQSGRMITILPYTSRWPEEFNQIKEQLAAALGPLALRIDHIGSTSVPGLGAKDIIDVQVTVAALTEEVKQALLTAEFQQFSEAARDHVPEGADPAPEKWQKFLFIQPAGQRRANIHVRVAGNPNQCYPLLFRDYLRAHPKSVQTVEIIKRELAKHHGHDVETYYDIKDPVYDLIWDAAQTWAKYTGWEP